ncbi:hypothetical protein YC2023_047762 [Brassica napus]
MFGQLLIFGSMLTFISMYIHNGATVYKCVTIKEKHEHSMMSLPINAAKHICRQQNSSSGNLNDFQNLDYVIRYYINFRSIILLGVRKDGLTFKIGSLNMNMPVSIDTAQHDPSIDIVN